MPRALTPKHVLFGYILDLSYLLYSHICYSAMDILASDKIKLMRAIV